MRSGVRGLWLLRQPGFPISRDLPAVCVGGTSEHGFSALIPPHWRTTGDDGGRRDCWHQVVSMEELLDAVFGRRFRFGVPIDVDVVVSIRSGFMECWDARCRARTRILTMGRSYLSNGCVRCDRLIGQGFEHDAWDEQETLCAFPIQMSEQWRHAIESHDGYEANWSVYPPVDRGTAKGSAASPTSDV